MDGRGVPLSLIVTAANVNDGKRLDAVLSAIIIKRKRPTVRRSKHLCADAGCRSAENLDVYKRQVPIAVNASITVPSASMMIRRSRLLYIWYPF